MNLLIITVDDMSADSIGAFGCTLPNATPHIDRLARQGLRFAHAYVQVGNCMPSRNVMWSGRYPHNNGVEGFYQVKNPGYPVLVDLMKEAGYFTAIRHKVSHSRPYHPYAWEREHMVSAVEFLPTLLDVLGLEHPQGMDGRSFAPLLWGQSQDHRHTVFKEYNENSGASRDPMRAVQTRRWLYVFNPWSNGERIMATATTGTPTYRRLAELAGADRTLAERHHLYQYRVVEELYDVQDDPDCLKNLIDDPTVKLELAGLRTALEAWMVKTGDHALEAMRQRHDPDAREAYVLKKEREAQARRALRRKAQRQASPTQPQTRTRLIALNVPKDIRAGQPVTVRVRHRLGADLGIQLVHVILKSGKAAKRVKRKVVKVSGKGVTDVTFAVPARVNDNVVRFAAFIGQDYASNLQHLQTAPIQVN
jgi:N-sulfoglucosamine sulfohydrolase